MSIWHWLIVLAVVVVVFRNKRLHWGDTNRRALARVPLYSAETTTGAEAEFAGEKLPKRIPLFVVVISAAVLIVTALCIV